MGALWKHRAIDSPHGFKCHRTHIANVAWLAVLTADYTTQNNRHPFEHVIIDIQLFKQNVL